MGIERELVITTLSESDTAPFFLDRENAAQKGLFLNVENKQRKGFYYESDAAGCYRFYSSIYFDHFGKNPSDCYRPHRGCYFTDPWSVRAIAGFELC